MCLSSRRGMLSNVDQLLGICGLYVFGKALNCFVRACFVLEHIVGSCMFSIEMGWKCFGVTSRLASILPKGNSRPSVFISVKFLLQSLFHTTRIPAFLSSCRCPPVFQINVMELRARSFWAIYMFHTSTVVGIDVDKTDI